MDESASHGQQFGPGSARGRRRGRGGCRNGHCLAGVGSGGDLAGSRDRLLPRMEPFVGELIARGLADAGVDVRTGVSVRALHRSGPRDGVLLELDDGTN